MKGGLEILPRLALAYYLLIAFVAAGVCGLIWGILRKWKNSWIVRQLFFAPISYILSHLLLKGMRTTSFFMDRDLLSILLVALAIYALLTIAWQVFLTRKKRSVIHKTSARLITLRESLYLPLYRMNILIQNEKSSAVALQKKIPDHCHGN